MMVHWTHDTPLLVIQGPDVSDEGRSDCQYPRLVPHVSRDASCILSQPRHRRHHQPHQCACAPITRKSLYPYRQQLLPRPLSAHKYLCGRCNAHCTTAWILTHRTTNLTSPCNSRLTRRICAADTSCTNTEGTDDNNHRDTTSEGAGGRTYP